METQTLHTPFHIPTLHTPIVHRKDLIRNLNNGLEQNKKLTLISAPVGFGKTTLILNWINDLQNRNKNQIPSIIWLSMDEHDNNLIQFMDSWIQAIQNTKQNWCESIKNMLELPQIPPVTAMLNEIIYQFSKTSEKFLLVLDDYHVIRNEKIHQAVEYFLNHQPESIHIILSTRTDPPLPISKLRARNDLIEIRSGNISFSISETIDYFENLIRKRLDKNLINILFEKTEGWIAGLQLAGIALQNSSRPEEFIKNFQGNHRYIIDYLIDEVLVNLSPEIQNFLYNTSLLNRFNAELCDEIFCFANSQIFLNNLEKENMFLNCLDDCSGWYRYHQLFSDVLQSHIDKSKQQEILSRAAFWFEKNGYIEEAVQYFIKVGNQKEISRSIKNFFQILLSKGDLHSILHWSQFLHTDQINTDPDFLSILGLCYLLTGNLHSAETYIELLKLLSVQDSRFPYQGRTFALQSWLSVTKGDLNTNHLAKIALESLDESDYIYKIISLVALGNSYAWGKELKKSSTLFKEAYLLGKKINNAFVSLGSLANLVFNLIELGELHEAESLCKSALLQYLDRDGNPLPVLGILYSPLASIYYEKGMFEKAKEFAINGIELSNKLFSKTILGGDAEIILANIALDENQTQKAKEILQKGFETAQQHNVMMVAFKFKVVMVQHLIWSGKGEEAIPLINNLEQLIPSTLPKSEHILMNLKARTLIETNRFTESLNILNQIETENIQEGSQRRLIGVLINKTILFKKTGQIKQALSSLESAIRIAAPQDYLTVFFPKTCLEIYPLFSQVRMIAPQFVDKIINAYQVYNQNIKSKSDNFIAKLSEKENVILSLIIMGKSNQEIANELFITVGTTKWHIHHILQKLGVKNRAQAILKVQEINADK